MQRRGGANRRDAAAQLASSRRGGTEVPLEQNGVPRVKKGAFADRGAAGTPAHLSYGGTASPNAPTAPYTSIREHQESLTICRVRDNRVRAWNNKTTGRSWRAVVDELTHVGSFRASQGPS